MISSIDNDERLAPHKEKILRDNALDLFNGEDRLSTPSIAATQCLKLPMAADGIIRLSRIEVYPQILETYASQDAYKSHIASPHFQKYKQGTLHMVKSLELCDQTSLNPDSEIINKIK